MMSGYPKLEIEENIRFCMTAQNQKKRMLSSNVGNSHSFLNLLHSWKKLHPAILYPGFNTPRYKPKSFISPIELAATHDWSISGAARFLRDCKLSCPSSELILKCLREDPPDIMEDFINQSLRSYYNALPRKIRNNIEKKGILIIDFHIDPFYGENYNHNIKKGPLKHSTNKGYNYLTADVYNDSFNVTIAVIHRPPKVKTHELFFKLLEKVTCILKPRLILMDGEFPTVRILRKLAEMNVPYIARKNMTQRVKTSLALYKKIEPHNWQRRWHRVDLRDSWIRKLTVPIEVTPQCINDKIKALMKSPFLDITPKQADKLYKLRFNIETGYRDKHLFQPRTCSVNLSTRLFLFLIAIFFWNLWQLSKYNERQPRYREDIFWRSSIHLRILRLSIFLEIFL